MQEKTFFVRQYKNAIEIAVITEETEEYIKGFSDLIRKQVHLYNQVRKMIDNWDNAEGKMLSVLLCKHEKKSVRWVADRIMRELPLEVEDRKHITL